VQSDRICVAQIITNNLLINVQNSVQYHDATLTSERHFLRKEFVHINRYICMNVW
jgi:hypothetical protein